MRTRKKVTADMQWTTEQYGWDPIPQYAGHTVLGAWDFGGDVRMPKGEFEGALVVTEKPVNSEEDVAKLRASRSGHGRQDPSGHAIFQTPVRKQPAGLFFLPQPFHHGRQHLRNRSVSPLDHEKAETVRGIAGHLFGAHHQCAEALAGNLRHRSGFRVDEQPERVEPARFSPERSKNSPCPITRHTINASGNWGSSVSASISAANRT